jgi:hypothetical protein
MTNQSDKQESIRTITGTTGTYEGDWHALFDAAVIDAGTFEGRLLAWINAKLAASYTELNSAMAALAIDNGYTDWNSMGAFDAS